MARAEQLSLFPEAAPHATRPDHAARHPVHVAMKRVRLAPSFRQQRVHKAIVEQVGRAVQERGVRVVHYAVGHDELQLLVEGANKQDLARQLQFLFSRVAFEVNRVAHRHGSLFRARHQRRALTSSVETRRAVMAIAQAASVASSERSAQSRTAAAPILARPQTWLARVGWRRASGPLRIDEPPRSAGAFS